MIACRCCKGDGEIKQNAKGAGPGLSVSKEKDLERSILMDSVTSNSSLFRACIALFRLSRPLTRNPPVGGQANTKAARGVAELGKRTVLFSLTTVWSLHHSHCA